MIQGVDSLKLLLEIDKQAKKNQPENPLSAAGAYRKGRNQIRIQ